MIRGCDIFCGAGGSSAGARAAGVDVVAGIDMCPTATATFAANFPDAQVVTNRLENVEIGSFADRIGPIDILLASPECRNHTCAKGSAPRDESSRATAMRAVEYADALRPRWLVIENVVYMRPWSRYEELKTRIEKLGYHLIEQTLDASDFGVAQSRRRLFLVGDLNRPAELSLRKRTGHRKSVQSILDAPGTWVTSPLFSTRRAKATLERLHAEWPPSATGGVSSSSTTALTDVAAGRLLTVRYARSPRSTDSRSSNMTAKYGECACCKYRSSSARWDSVTTSACRWVPAGIAFASWGTVSVPR